MNILELNKEIDELGSNIGTLIETIDALKKREIQLLREIETLKEENQNHQKQMDFLREKTKMVGLASAVDPSEKEEMKSKIKSLVREIDGCIAMIKS